MRFPIQTALNACSSCFTTECMFPSRIPSAPAFVKHQSYRGKGQWRRIVSPPGTGVTMWSLFCQELAVNSTPKYLGGLPSNVLTYSDTSWDVPSVSMQMAISHVPFSECICPRSWILSSEVLGCPILWMYMSQVILSSEVVDCPTDLPGCPIW